MAVGTALASVFMAGLGAAPASANAPNPIKSVTGSSVQNPDNGTVTVTLRGNWSWDTLNADDDDGPTKSSPQLQCDQRYGIGWAVSWWGLGTGNNPPADFSVQNDAYQLSPGGTSPENSPVAFSSGHSTSTPVPGYAGAISEIPVGSIKLQGTDQTFWVGGVGGAATPAGPGPNQQAVSGYAGGTPAIYDGYDAPLCPTTSGPSGQVDQNGAPLGTWSARATYPTASDVPKVLCVNFYDMHQKEFQPPNQGGSDWSPAADSDNSIQTNDYNPNIGGNCFTTPAITVATSAQPVTPPIATAPASSAPTTLATPIAGATPASSAPTTLATPIAGATDVHTGEPWAGSRVFELILLAFGVGLIGLGDLRRRRTRRLMARSQTR